MKRIAELLIVTFILGSFASSALAQDKEELKKGPFDGLWKTARGSIVKIDGDQGVFLYTHVESWKGYVNQVVIRNIRLKDDKWVADEFIAPDGEGIWAEVEWELKQDRIIRRIVFQDKPIESYYERIRLHKPHHVELGFMYYNFDYEEDLPSPFKSTEEEWLPGFCLSYTYKDKDEFYTKAFVEYTDADTDYDGTTQVGVPVKDTTDNIFFRFELDIGYTFDSGEKSSVSPYIGWGYRYWERGLGGALPFDETYTWQYIPVGIRADFELNDKWDIGANVAARFMFSGKMRADSSGFDFKVDLDNETGWFAEIPIRYKFSPSWSLVVTPWYEYSEIGKSDPVYTIFEGRFILSAYEPSSTTDQYGINFGVQYSF